MSRSIFVHQLRQVCTASRLICNRAANSSGLAFSTKSRRNMSGIAVRRHEPVIGRCESHGRLWGGRFLRLKALILWPQAVGTQTATMIIILRVIPPLRSGEVDCSVALEAHAIESR